MRNASIVFILVAVTPLPVAADVPGVAIQPGQGASQIVVPATPLTTLPPLFSEIGSITLRDYLSSLIDALRKETAITADYLTKSIERHSLDDLERGRELKDIERRLTTLEGLTTRIDINTAAIANITARLTTLEAGGSPVAIRSQTRLDVLELKVQADEAKSAGGSSAYETVLAVASFVLGVAIPTGLILFTRRQAPAKR